MAKNISQDKARPRVLVDYIKHAKNNTIIVANTNFKSIRKNVLAKVENIPKYIRRRLILQYIAIFNKKLPKDNEKFANIWLRETVKPIEKIIKNCPFPDKKALKNDELLEHYARQNAAIAINYIEHLPSVGEYQDNLFNCYNELVGLCREWRVSMPHFKRINNKQTELEDKIYFAECALLRVSSEDWWEKQLKKIAAQTNEHLLIAIGDVQKSKSPYISAQSFTEWKNQQRANRDYLEMMEVVQQIYDAETGQEYESVTTLKEIADASSSNPKHRFTELMLRCRGLENIAIDDDFSSVFLTVTCPSKYHAVSKGQINPKWSGNTPKEAQAYLASQFAKVRARLARQKINYYGVRVTEPHHDGTPHWHLLLFVAKQHESDLISTFKRYALEVDGDEQGAAKHRFTVEYIDPKKGSATGYIAKYLSKNINGEYMANDNSKENDNSDFDSGKTASEGAQRATAWASRWRLRQFQFFGSEPVTIYREARRLKTAVDIEAIEAIRQAVETSDKKGKWYAFTKALQENRVKIAYKEKTNIYNEKAKAIKGLVCASGGVKTRNEGVLLRKRGSVLPWSPVTNCTAVINSDRKDINTIKKLGFDDEEITFLINGQKITNGDGFIYQIKNNELREFRQHG